MKTKKPVKVTIEMTIVPHGYEADFSIGDKEVGHSIRDFAIDQNPEDLAVNFILEMEGFLDRFRSRYDK